VSNIGDRSDSVSPKRFGDYELLEKIATGGMAEVFLARSFGVSGFQRKLVIKRILPNLAKSDHYVSLFVQEAKICSLLDHPNVVHVFDLGVVDEEHFIAMEYIHGRDLTRTVRKLRARESKLPLALAVSICSRIARGLSYAHSRIGPSGNNLGIVHRDISPHNIMLSFDGEVRILDFGIARLEGNAQGGGDRPGGGKFAYMSPEQASGNAIDHRSDVFSLGIVLYELLVNHRLFQHEDPEEKLRRVREAEVPDPRKEAPEVSDELWAILQTALAKDPNDRYSSASEFEQALRVYLFETGDRTDDTVLGEFMQDLFKSELELESGKLELVGPSWGIDDAHTDVTGGGQTGESMSSDSGSLHHIAEQKRVAALAVDIMGLTQPWATLGPEAVVRQHKAIQKKLEKVVARHRGWIERSDDEGMIVLFGVPKVREDDIDRALACGEHLIRATAKFRKAGTPIQVAVGVHRGDVVWRGGDTGVSVLARGDTIKLPKRLASHADIGTITTSADVWKEVSGRWLLDQGEPLVGRGPSRPVFTLRGRKPDLHGYGAGRWLTRGDEVDVLRRALKQLTEGEGALISIAGIAGGGKSRLFREVRRSAEQSGISFYWSQCLPEGTARPMASFRGVVASALGITPSDGRAEIVARLERLSELHLAKTTIATLAALFSIEIAGRLSAGKEDIYSAASQFVTGLSVDSPPVIAVEDIHNMTPREFELLNHLLTRENCPPVLWLLSHRGDWPEQLTEPDSTVSLPPLNESRQSRLVAEVLGAKSLGQGLSSLVAATGNGSALFATEIAKSLKDRGAVVVRGGEALLLDSSNKIELPVTLEAMILAKVDQLAIEEKSTLQIASVMGASFSSSLLQAALGVEIEEHLLALEQAGFVQSESSRGASAYSFVSQQVLDVVKKASVGQQLREYHGRIASAIERTFRDQLELHYEHLAYHCARGGRLLDAARNYEMVGDRLRRLAELDRSLKSFHKGISILESVHETSGTSIVLEGIASMHLKAGEVSALLGDQATAQRHLQVAQEIAEEVGAIEIDVGCLTALGQLYLSNGRLQMAKMIIEQGLSQARISRLPMAEVDLLLALANVHLEFGEVEEAKSLQEQALGHAKRDPHSEAGVLSAIAILHSRFGDNALARKTLSRALELTRVVDDKLLESRLKNNIGIAWFGERQYDKAHSCFCEALEINRGSGYRRGEVLNLHNIGDSLFRLGEEARAHVAFTEAAEIAKGFGLSREITFNELYIGYIDAVHGDPVGGREMIDRCIKESERLEDQETQLMGCWLLGKLLIHQGDIEGGLDVLNEALGRAEEAQNNWMAADLIEAVKSVGTTGGSV